MERSLKGIGKEFERELERSLRGNWKGVQEGIENENYWLNEDNGISHKILNLVQEHNLIHSGEMPFSCHLCPKRFNRSYTLKNHMKLHSTTQIGLQVLFFPPGLIFLDKVTFLLIKIKIIFRTVSWILVSLFHFSPSLRPFHDFLPPSRVPPHDTSPMYLLIRRI